jgi:hypothetical protein
MEPKFVAAALLSVAGLLLSTLSACATTTRPAYYEFAYGELRIDSHVNILNYRLSTRNEVIIEADQHYVTVGQIQQTRTTGGFYPIPNTLYMKWMVTTTGEVYQDTVDLEKLLPSDMDGKIIHASIDGAALSIYVIEKTDPFVKLPSDIPDCPVDLYRRTRCTRIYPDHWSNF